MLAYGLVEGQQVLDNLLITKLYAAAAREGLDLNDPKVQQKLFVRRQQLESMISSMIEQHTKHCGCGKKKEIGDRDENTRENEKSQ